MSNCAKVDAKKVNLNTLTDVLTQTCPGGNTECAIWAHLRTIFAVSFPRTRREN